MSAEFGPSWSGQMRADLHAMIDPFVERCLESGSPDLLLVYCGDPPLSAHQLNRMAEGIKAVLRGEQPSFTVTRERP